MSADREPRPRASESPRAGALSHGERWLLAALLAVAATLRLWNLGATVFWVDEAESTINALTILQHGVPTDRYLDQPIYENTLVEPWPGHPEYEFRDSSYSAKGLATYHGWLPLYVIAGSLELAGIEPDVADGTLAPKHGPWWIRRLTLAARLPSIAFGLLFLVALLFAGREIAGPAAAWAATAVAAVADVVINYARDARYYSLTLLLGTLACWLGWRIARRARWRDIGLAALVLCALFHTHVVTCVVACAMVALQAPWIVRQEGGLRKLVALGGVVAAAALPWAWWSGFFEQAGAIPKAWPLLDLPRDLVRFPLERPAAVGLLAAGVGGALVSVALRAAARDGRGAIGARFTAAFAAQESATWFLAAWLLVGWVGFVLLMPAVSNVFTRMALPILGPGLLLAGSTAGSLAHWVRGKPSGWCAALTLLAFVFLATDTRPTHTPRDEGLTRNVHATLDWMRKQELPAGTRLYSTPNQHLTLSLYSGVPVQSVAPIRKEFLDRWPGGVVLFETCGPYVPPSDQEIEQAAGAPLADAELAGLRSRLTREAAARRLRTKVAEVTGGPAAGEIDTRFAPLVARVPELSRRSLARKSPTDWCPAVFRGFELADWTDWWRIYFFRFVDPDARKDAGANYAARMRTAHAELLPTGWSVWVAPPLAR